MIIYTNVYKPDSVRTIPQYIRQYETLIRHNAEIFILDRLY